MSTSIRTKYLKYIYYIYIIIYTYEYSLIVFKTITVKYVEYK